MLAMLGDSPIHVQKQKDYYKKPQFGGKVENYGALNVYSDH